MRNTWRIGLVSVLLVMGNGVAAHGQEGRGYFSRVVTPGVSRYAPSSTTRSMTNVARSRGVAAVSRSSVQTDSLRPYSAQALAQSRGVASDVPRSSTWQQEIRPVEFAQDTPQPQARNYFPGMRPSMSPQHPVTLTARNNMMAPCCTLSRSHVFGGGHHR
jgi:hypothetical protein